MIKAIPILLLLLVFPAPVPSSGADAPFAIELKELERPDSAPPAGREREKTKKQGRSGKKMNRAGHAARRPPIAAPPPATWICPVPEQEPAAAVDSLLTLLQISPDRNKTVEAGQGTDTPFSITVDRYFEYKGGRYIVSIGGTDPSSYTLLRILEAAGYKVLRLTGLEGFEGAAGSLLSVVGVAPDFGRHLLQEGKGITGFLIKPEGAGGRRVVVSAERVEPGEKWVLAPGCGAR